MEDSDRYQDNIDLEAVNQELYELYKDEQDARTAWGVFFDADRREREECLEIILEEKGNLLKKKALLTARLNGQMVNN